MASSTGIIRGGLLVAWLVVTAPAWAEAPAKQAASTFIRVQRDKNEDPISLETATVRYVPAGGEGGLVVDLVGVVHLGDRSYYEKLNKQLSEYDVVLYELVAPEGTRIPKGGRRDADNPIAMIQQLAKGLLRLESQLELIDYTPKHFVHADLSPEQMAEAIRKRGDDGMTIMLGIFADLLRQQNIAEMKPAKKGGRPAPELDPFALLLDPNGPVHLKRMMAEQMEDAGSGAGLGQTLTTILVDDRNAAAMKVFQKELAKGKKKIAIFYGAAHMPDFEKRLKADFGLKRSEESWLTAWDLKTR